MTPEKKPGLRVLIHQLIKEKRGQKVHSGDIERFALLNNYKASNGDRRARDLVEEYQTKKGVKVKSPYFCPDIKHAIEGKSKVYWYEEPQKSPRIYRCSQCSKTAVTYKENKPVCQTHSVREPAQASLL